MGDFLGDFLLSLGDFLTETSGHPEHLVKNNHFLSIFEKKTFFLQKASFIKNNLAETSIIKLCRGSCIVIEQAGDGLLLEASVEVTQGLAGLYFEAVVDKPGPKVIKKFTVVIYECS